MPMHKIYISLRMLSACAGRIAAPEGSHEDGGSHHDQDPEFKSKQKNRNFIAYHKHFDAKIPEAASRSVSLSNSVEVHHDDNI